jgi:hypothetical protein
MDYEYDEYGNPKPKKEGNFISELPRNRQP